MNSHPIGLTSDLAPRQIMRATIGQVDMAVWRSVSGVISAWDNRCPHRGMRLSHGFVRGESLACAYHGWHYNCEGYCHYIPAHPELTPPKTVRPLAYGVVEQGGLIWVNPSNSATPVELPENSIAVRTLSFTSDSNTVMSALAETSWNGGESGPTIDIVSDKPRVMTFKFVGDDERFFVALHQPQADKVDIHALATGGMSIERRINFSRWLESARRYAESAVGGRS